MTSGAKPTNEPQGPGRYEPLTRYLKDEDASTATLTFAQLGDILGFRLPAAASNHVEWWQGGSNPQAHGWRDAGWSFVRTDRRAQTVTFRRDAPATAGRRAGPASRAKAPAAPAKRRVTRTTQASGAARSPKKGLASGLMLIPDSPHVRRGGDPTWRRQSTALALLGEAGARLAEARRALAELVGEAAGPDLGGDGNRRAYLPALERFDGPLYEAAAAISRSAAERETMRRSCLIVSALYGLVTTNEPIREYALTMETPLPDGRTVSHWWREHGLGEALRSYVAETGVADLYSFLPAEHAAALDGLELAGTATHQVASAAGSDAPEEQAGALARLVKEGDCVCASCGPVATSAE
jgi:hypothetical protein